MSGFAENNQPIEQNSFFSAYVSLILIVLTFILAFFFRPDAFVTSNSVASNLIGQNGNQISQELIIESPFQDSGQNIQLDSWAGVIFTLRNHDVDAEIRVESASDEEALVRGIEIFKGLISEGIPASAVRVYGIAAKSNKVLVKFYDLPE
jgi:hypothetical protein